MRTALLLAPLLVAPSLARLDPPVFAGTLKGTVYLPTEPRPGPGESRPLANWKVENGQLPVLPAPPEPRSDTIVVLEAERSGETLVAQTAGHATVEARGLKLEPRVSPALAGTTFDFKNADKVPRTLSLRGAEKYMAPEATLPGEARSVRFSATGIYTVRDHDYPHARATLIILGTPYFARVDDKGGFRLDAPDGRYVLKVFHRGAWAYSQPVEVGRSGEVTVRLPALDTRAAPRDGEPQERK